LAIGECKIKDTRNQQRQTTLTQIKAPKKSEYKLEAKTCKVRDIGENEKPPSSLFFLFGRLIIKKQKIRIAGTARLGEHKNIMWEHKAVKLQASRPHSNFHHVGQI